MSKRVFGNDGGDYGLELANKVDGKMVTLLWGYQRQERFSGKVW